MTVSTSPNPGRRRNRKDMGRGELIRSASLRSISLLDQDELVAAVPLTPRPPKQRTKSFDHRLQRSQSIRSLLAEEDNSNNEGNQNSRSSLPADFLTKKEKLDMDMSNSNQLMRMRRHGLRQSKAFRDSNTTNNTASTTAITVTTTTSTPTEINDISNNTADTESVRSSVSSRSPSPEEEQRESSARRKESLRRGSSRREVTRDSSGGASARLNRSGGTRRSSSSRNISDRLGRSSSRKELETSGSFRSKRDDGSLRRSSSRRGDLRRSSSRRERADGSLGRNSSRRERADNSLGRSSSRRDSELDSSTTIPRSSSSRCRREVLDSSVGTSASFRLSNRRDVLGSSSLSRSSSRRDLVLDTSSTRRGTNTLRRTSSRKEILDGSDSSGFMDGSTLSVSQRAARRRDGLMRAGSRRSMHAEKVDERNKRAGLRRSSSEKKTREEVKSPSRRRSKDKRKDQDGLEVLLAAPVQDDDDEEDLFTIVSGTNNSQKGTRSGLLQRSRSYKKLSPARTKPTLTSDKIKRSLSESEHKIEKLHFGELKVKPTSVSTEEFKSWEDGIKAVAAASRTSKSPPPGPRTSDSRIGGLLLGRSFSMRDLVRPPGLQHFEELNDDDE